MVIQVLSLPPEVDACLRTDVSGRCRVELGSKMMPVLAGRQARTSGTTNRDAGRERCEPDRSHHYLTRPNKLLQEAQRSLSVSLKCLRSHDCPPSTTAPTHRTSTSTSPARLYPPAPPHDEGTRFSQPKPRAQDRTCRT
jgi:hypothetical protein